MLEQSGTEQKLLGIGDPKRGILCQLKLDSLNLLENSKKKLKNGNLKGAHVGCVSHTFIILDLLNRKCNRRHTNIIFCIQGLESEVPELQKHYEAKGRGE